MVKRTSLRDLGLRKAPTAYGVFLSKMKARYSASDSPMRRRLAFKQPKTWQHHRSAEVWRCLYPHQHNFYSNESRQMLSDLHSRATKLNKIRAERRDREEGIESDCLQVDGVGLTAPQTLFYSPQSVVGQKKTCYCRWLGHAES